MSSSAIPAGKRKQVARGATPPAVWLVLAVLGISIAAVYGRALNAPLFFDDQVSIIENPSIVRLWPLVGTAEQPGPLNPPADLPTSSRPLVNLSFALNYHFGSVDPVGYHLVNVLLHFFCSVLLWSIARRTLLLPYFSGRCDADAGWLALGTAAIWALHPLQTEAVIYATQRTELMMACCYLATTYCCLRYWALAPAENSVVAESVRQILPTILERRSVWLCLATVACLCGMASKEVMVSAPVMMLLFERTFIAGSLANAVRRSWPLYVALFATWAALVALILSSPRGASAGFHFDVSAASWWFTQCKVLLIYLKLAVWPAPLLCHYELPYLGSLSEAWPYVLPVLLLAVVAVVLLWRNNPIGFLLTFMAAILSPTFVIPVLTEMAAERRMYLPLAALAVLLVVGVYAIAQTRWDRNSHSSRAGSKNPRGVVFLGAAILAVVAGVASASRLADYHDEMRLWQQVADAQPGNYMAHYSLGMLFNRAGEEQKSFAELKAAVEANPNYPHARSAFGFALINAQQYPAAVESIKAALEIEPDHVAALNNMGIALTRMGRFPEAIEYLQHALRVSPEHAQAHDNLGKALAGAGKPVEAIQELRAAVALAPGDADVLSDLANALASTNQMPEAIKTFEAALQLQPQLAGAHTGLGIALFQSGDPHGAVVHLRRAAELRPSDPSAQCNLANVAAAQGDFKQAATNYGQAVALQPNFAEARYGLGTALLQIDQPQPAVEHLQKAIELRPELLFAYANLATALARSNRTKEAIQVADQGIAAAQAAKDDPAASQIQEVLKQFKAEQQSASDNKPGAK